MSMPESSVTFNVTRQKPELLLPTKSTPYELKELTMIDQTIALQKHTSFLQIYRKYDHAEGKDPAHVIKKAIAQALVYYYPLAGRLREIDCNKTLVVDCTGEGVMFVEADADYSVKDFGETIHPPFLGAQELLFYRVTNFIIDTPLLHFQVTRLKCGGFVLGTTVNHVLMDGIGIAQFMNAVGEMARGFQTPSLLPVWERHIFRARDPPQVTFKHPEFDQECDTTITSLFSTDKKMVVHTFLFDPPAISSLRELIDDPNFPYCSTFELISAAMWRTRTLSMKLDTTMRVRFLFPVNIRNKLNPPIPDGYYGNVIVCAVATATAGELNINPFTHAVEVIKKAKEIVNEEYTRSAIDFVVLNGQMPIVLQGNSWCLTDIKYLGFHEIDYGWGKAAFGGLAMDGNDVMPLTWSLSVPVIIHNNENIGIAVPIALTKPMMDSFMNELNIMMGRASDCRTWKKTSSTLFRWETS